MILNYILDNIVTLLLILIIVLTLRKFWKIVWFIKFSCIKLWIIIFYVGIIRYIKNRILQFVRLVTITSVLPSIFIGIITIWLTLFTYIKNSKRDLPIEINELNLYSFIFLLITAIFAGRYLFKKQTPEQYAQLSIDGRKSKEIFIYTSYLIWKECSFILTNWAILRLINSIKENAASNSKFILKYKESIITNYISSIENRINNQEIIKHSYDRISNSLNIPSTRISDYFFQFNPHIFISEFRKVSIQLNEILLVKEIEDSISDKEILLRINYISDFFEVIKKLMSYQLEITINCDLLPFIIGSSSTYGASNALKSYSLGLQTISKQKGFFYNTLKTFGVYEKINFSVSKNNIYKKLKFLFHKRRMYPGFDIHIALMNLAKIYDKENLKSNKNALSLEYLLELIYNKSPEIIQELDNPSLLNTEKIKEEEEETKNKEETNVCLLLKHLISTVNKHITLQRLEIVTKFYDFIEREFNSSHTKLVLITQGYSSVVNTTIEKIINQMLIKDQKQSGSEIKQLDKYNITIYLLIDDDERLLDNQYERTRYVRYKFKMNPDIPKKTKKKVLVKAGNIKWLKERYDKEENKIYVLSGAEFFQEDPSKGFRLINNEKSEQSLLNQLNTLNNTKPTHIILAEEYKNFDRDISKSDIYKDSLNRDHLEFLNLYSWQENRIIITGNEIYKREITKDFSTENFDIIYRNLKFLTSRIINNFSLAEIEKIKSSFYSFKNKMEYNSLFYSLQFLNEIENKIKKIDTNSDKNNLINNIIQLIINGLINDNAHEQYRVKTFDLFIDEFGWILSSSKLKRLDDK